MPDISVVVMAYNEAPSLEPVVREIVGVLAGLHRPYEVVIVDDGSADGTSTVADRLAGSVPGLRAVHHPVNLGLGGVYRTGFASARGTFVTFFPADGQFPATIIEQFRSLIGEADMVLGYLPQGKRSLLAKTLSRVERLIYRCLFGPMPKFQGVLMFRRALLDAMVLRSQGRGWAVLMELILRTSRQGYRITSAPTALRPRQSGQSKVNNFRTAWANFRQVLALRRLMP
jgi:glycosyltransferase involved in cell wall biosynthesis